MFVVTFLLLAIPMFGVLSMTVGLNSLVSLALRLGGIIGLLSMLIAIGFMAYSFQHKQYGRNFFAAIFVVIVSLQIILISIGGQNDF